jgi:uncharacterized RDD family membrane protein YckC
MNDKANKKKPVEKAPLKDSQNESNWDFQIDETKIQNIGSQNSKPAPLEREKKKRKSSHAPSLDLDSVPKRRTRSQQAANLNGLTRDQFLGENQLFTYYEVASLKKRAYALFLDVFFTLGLYSLLRLGHVLKSINIQNLYEFLELGLSVNDCLLLSSSVFYFFTVVMGSVVFGRSFGKYILKIKIVSTNNQEGNIFLVFLRELFFRPLSVCSILGIIPIFFNHKGMALHDYLSNTWVVDDEIS